MTTPAFERFFQEVNGYPPFPWQADLAERVTSSGWPASIGVPTGLGKTSVLDVAVYALALHADRPMGERLTPRRIALVVDRRLVVDSAHGHAEQIADAVARGDGPAARWVRGRLELLGGDDDRPLDVVRMRGGVTWNARWLRSPAQPAIVAGTVDQFGSRLLFRGYGQSDRLKPIDAALVGTDMLCLLDEAHMSEPLRETIEFVARIEASAARAVVPPVKCVAMTATQRHVDGDVVSISERDQQSEAAARRLTARKEAVLVSAGGALARSPAQLLVTLASDAIATAPSSVVGVVVNTVALARQVYEALPTGIESALVIGRCRPVEREVGSETWLARTKVGRDRSASGSFVLVATQTVEVGVDLDLDVLITQSAPIDALLQRFGRVDRLGHVGETRSFVVRPEADDPVYGGAEQRTWQALCGQAEVVALGNVRDVGDALVARSDLDFGPLAASEWLSKYDVASLASAVAPAPLPTPETVGWWRRTSPIPVPDEDVSPYLHGIGRWSPTVSVMWRLLPEPTGAALADQLWRVPADASEMVEVPISAAQAFLSGSAGDRVVVADLEGIDAVVAANAADAEPAAGWVRRDDDWVGTGQARLRPGDLLVLSAADGGHDEHGWSGIREHVVVDVGGLRSRRVRLRVAVDFLGQFVDDEEARQIEEIVRAADPPGADTRDDVLRRLREGAAGPYASVVVTACDRLANSTWLLDHAEPADGNDEPTLRAAFLVEPTSMTVGRNDDTGSDAADDDNDVSTSMLTATPVTLQQHLGAVGDRAAEYARRSGLDADLVAASRLAGRFHDLGKAELRFQTLLHGGRRHRAELGRRDASIALAKSNRLDRRAERTIARQSGWPAGMRHEAVSLALVQSAPDELFDGVDRELVEHLVASHHGFARPLFPPVLDPEPAAVEVAFDGVSFTARTASCQNGLGHAASFDRLCARYGTWGLALLEAVVRLADMAVSEEGS